MTSFLIYCIFCALLVLLLYVSKAKRRTLLFVILLLIAVFSLRCELGVYQKYYINYKTVQQDSVLNIIKNSSNFFSRRDALYGFEILYTIFVSISPFSFFFFIFEITFIFLMSVFFFIRQFLPSRHYYLAILLLLDPIVVFTNLSALRQAIASSLFLLALFLQTKNKLMTSIFVLILGGLFHNSLFLLTPIVLLVYLCVYYFKTKLIQVLIVLFFAILLVPLVLQIPFFNSLFHYSDYYFTHENSSKLFFQAVLLLPVFICFLGPSHLSKTNTYFLYLYSFLIAIRAISIIDNIPMINRLTYYLDLVSLIIIPISIQRNKINKSLLVTFIILFTLARTSYFFYNPSFIGNEEIDFFEQNIFVSGDMYLDD